MLRTCDVRLPAIEFTFSVRSRQTPETPRTWACPPSLPSVPTSRATRVTSSANAESWSTIVFTVVQMRRNSPLSGWPDQLVDERVDRLCLDRPGTVDAHLVDPLGHPPLAPDHTADPDELPVPPLLVGGEVVEALSELAGQAVVTGQPDRKVAVVQAAQRVEHVEHH